MSTAGDLFAPCLRHLPGKGGLIYRFVTFVLLLPPPVADDHGYPGKREGDAHDEGGGYPPMPGVHHDTS